MQAVFRDESLTLSAGMAEEAKRKLREFEVACKKGQQGVA